jgi:hypothetical protein
MRQILLLLALFQSTATLLAQTAEPPAEALLPDSPGTVQTQIAQTQTARAASAPPPCSPDDAKNSNIITTTPDPPSKQPPCAPQPDRNPYQRFLNSPEPLPLTSRQKGLLAVHNLVDPANLATITVNAGITIGIDPHTAYGPGWKGFGRNAGYSLVQDATGEFFSTFMFDSLFHQDPHYHRLAHGTVPRRFLHAVSHTVITQHDDGTPMVNYSTLLTYPISAEIANLYVPGVATNAPSTAKRVAIGLASNPIDDIVTEFLPDFAKRVHIHVVFVEQILNNISTGQPM